MLADKKIAGPRENVGDGYPCDRCGTIVGAEFRRCKIDLPIGNRLASSKPVMRLCLRCIAALEGSGAIVEVLLSPAERRAKLRLIRPDEPSTEPAPTIAKEVAESSSQLITDVAWRAVEFVTGPKHYMDERQKQHAVDLLARAIERRCDSIVKAAAARPDLEREQKTQEQRREKARRTLTSDLRSGRKRLAQLRQQLKTATEELGRGLEKLASLQLQAHPGGPYPPPPLPFLSPTNDGAGLPDGPGVYFLWHGDVITYVGQSIRLCNRVRLPSHDRLNDKHRISFIQCDASDLNWIECWYIGYLRPALNFGKNSSAYKAALREKREKQ